MASVESVPAYLHPGVPVSHPPHLEGDPSLATEILPGPPSLASLQQANLPRKDNKKPTVPYSYLPGSDPGTTYTTHFTVGSVSAAPTAMDGSRRKRARLDKGYVCKHPPYTRTANLTVNLSLLPAHSPSRRPAPQNLFQRLSLRRHTRQQCWRQVSTCFRSQSRSGSASRGPYRTAGSRRFVIASLVGL